MKILIIDDDPMIRRMAGFILRKKGYEQAEAGSGDEGIALMREQKPDLTLIDVEMPDTDGFETLEKIRSDDGLKDSKVCMMTGTLTDEARARAEGLGAVGCIEKPLDAAVLYDIIGKV